MSYRDVQASRMPMKPFEMAEIASCEDAEARGSALRVRREVIPVLKESQRFTWV